MAGRHRKPPQPRGSGRHRRPPSRSSVAVPAIAAVVVLGAGGVAAAAAFSGGSAPPPAPAVPAAARQLSTAPVVDGSGSSPTPVSVPTGSPAPDVAPTTPDAGAAPGRRRPAVALALSVRRSISWVQVTAADGRVLFEGILRPGRRLVYRRGPLAVVIGNAGVVRLQRGRHVTSPAGRNGEVLRFTVPA